MAVTTIRNETPLRLTLVSIAGEKMDLAPLEEKGVSEDTSFDFEDLAREGKISKGEQAPSGFGEYMTTVLLGGGFWLVVIGSVLANRDPWFGVSPQNWPMAVWGSGIALLVIAAAVTIIRGTNSLSLVVRWTIQAISLSVILAIGLGLPTATVYYFGGGEEFLQATMPESTPNGTGVAPENVTLSAALPEDSRATEKPGQTQTSLAIYGRLLQLSLIAIASLLPILLFFLFDRYQLGTLRKRLYINLFRLDPSLKTTSEIHARFGSQIDEAYGSLDQDRGRLSPGSRWPVLVCALVITIGWIMTLSPVGDDYNPQNSAAVLVSLAPQPTAMVFAFLGVYFYSLRLIALRYARGDLKPKAYTHIMVRVFIVTVLSWVWDAIIPGSGLGVLIPAFIFGILPDEFFVLLKEKYRGRINIDAVAQTPLPLNEIEGIDLYDLGRLESEGIVNVEGLAHHELIDLIIETRIPVPRLVDWVDQAILYLHLIGGTDTNSRVKLRDYGIRTATDLQLAWDKAESRLGDSLLSLKKLLGSEGELNRLEVIRDALSDDEWMKVVSEWRSDRPPETEILNAIPTTAEALEKRGDKDLADDRFPLALKYYQQSLEVRDSAPVRRKIAIVLAQAPAEFQDHEAARRHANRAYELAPDNYEGMLQLIEVYLSIEDVEDAEKMHHAASKVVKSLTNSKKQKTEAKRLNALGSRLDSAKKSQA